MCSIKAYKKAYYCKQKSCKTYYIRSVSVFLVCARLQQYLAIIKKKCIFTFYLYTQIFSARGLNSLNKINTMQLWP